MLSFLGPRPRPPPSRRWENPALQQRRVRWMQETRSLVEGRAGCGTAERCRPKREKRLGEKGPAGERTGSGAAGRHTPLQSKSGRPNGLATWHGLDSNEARHDDRVTMN